MTFANPGSERYKVCQTPGIELKNIIKRDAFLDSYQLDVRNPEKPAKSEVPLARPGIFAPETREDQTSRKAVHHVPATMP